MAKTKAKKAPARKPVKAAKAKAAKPAKAKPKTVEPIPEGRDCVMPYLSIKGAAEAIAFYEKAFGAKVVDRAEMPDGKVMHAELSMGNARFMLADEFPDMGFTSPRTIGGTPVLLSIYVKDVDALFARAISCGATEKRPVKDQFYGDRSGSLEDPFGHMWNISTHKEDLTPEEIQERARTACQ